jgi:hypothetical protein
MIIEKSAARSSRRNVGNRPKTMCRQKLRNEVPERGNPLYLAVNPRLSGYRVSVRFLHDFPRVPVVPSRVLCCSGDSPVGPKHFQNKARREWWSIHIEAWQRSGLSQRRYCKNHRLTDTTFTRWLRAITDAEAAKSARKTLKSLPKPSTKSVGDSAGEDRSS